jgi:hypothetical protein
MTGSAEFSTWAALAFSASFAGLCAIYTSSSLVLIAAALAGAYVGYKVERVTAGSHRNDGAVPSKRDVL